MLELRKMTDEEFCFYREKSLKDFTLRKVKNEKIDIKKAQEIAEKVFGKLLPNAQNTENNFLYAVINDSNKQVGILWFGVNENALIKEAFLFDIEIFEDFRGKGYAKKALQLMEEKLKEKNVFKISLHVDADNDVAYNLYKKMNYYPTNIKMERDIEKN